MLFFTLERSVNMDWIEEWDDRLHASADKGEAIIKQFTR